MALLLDIAKELYEVVLLYCRLFLWAVELGRSVWTWFAHGSCEGAKPGSRKLGLDKKITLPETEIDAMKRLLSCKGKDAYCILGLPSNCSDEDIRRHYRKQAFLVHPDKNQLHGAEEAFKILARAFELIGVPARREEYDIQNLDRAKAMEEFDKKFDDMVDKLKKKMEEASNTMYCGCGETHRRYLTKRYAFDARFCDRCEDYHSVKDGDVWAESTWLGFIWYFYACMGNDVYDITEWAGCQNNTVKHMKANAHQIHCRLMTGRNLGSQPQPSSKHNAGSRGGRSPVISDADMDEFLNNLLPLASAAADTYQTNGLQIECAAAGSGSEFSQGAYGSGIAGSGMTGESWRPSKNKQYHRPSAHQPCWRQGRRKPRR